MTPEEQAERDKRWLDDLEDAKKLADKDLERPKEKTDK